MNRSRARFSRQFSGVMDGLLFRHRSLQWVYSRSDIFRTGGSGFEETSGNLFILQLPHATGYTFVQLLRSKLHCSSIPDDRNGSSGPEVTEQLDCGSVSMGTRKSLITPNGHVHNGSEWSVRHVNHLLETHYWQKHRTARFMSPHFISCAAGGTDPPADAVCRPGSYEYACRTPDYRPLIRRIMAGRRA